MNKSWKEAEKAMKTGKTKDHTIYVTPEIFSKIFSPQKIKLLMNLKNQNIYQLAKTLNRKYESVYRDIKFLEGLGVINIKKQESKSIPYLKESLKIAEFAI